MTNEDDGARLRQLLEDARFEFDDERREALTLLDEMVALLKVYAERDAAENRARIQRSKVPPPPPENSVIRKP